MNLIANITPVVEHDQCIACGACIQACPEDAIVPAYHDGRGAHEVSVSDDTGCSDCAQHCRDVCPSVAFSFRDAHPRLGGDALRLGPIRDLRLSHAPAHQFNGVSSSGGMVRVMIESWLRQARTVICLAATPEGYGAVAIDQTDALRQLPGSIYHGVSFNAMIPLLRAAPAPVMLVAIPCVFEGLARYVRGHAPELEAKIGLRVGLICGWMFSDHAWRTFAELRGISEPVTDVQYRGEDKVGQLKLRTAAQLHRYSRRQFDSVHAEAAFKSSFSRVYNRLRCRLCEDHLNVLADVAVGDAWLARLPEDTDKISIVAIRSERGLDLLDALEAEGRVHSEPATVAELVETQSANLAYGREARALNGWLQAQGVPTPAFRFDPEEPPPAPPGARQIAAFETEMRWRQRVRAGGGHAWYRRYLRRFLLRRIVRRLPAPLLRALSRLRRGA